MKHRCRRSESGQALVETAIVVPVMLLVVLGGVQLAMLQHGRIMTEYAAYNAARAGIVHNGDQNVMQNAAMIAVLPLYYRTDSAERLAAAWARVKALSEVTQAGDMVLATVERLIGDLLGISLPQIFPNVSLVRVEVTSPDEEAMDAYEDWVAQQRATAAEIDPGGALVYPQGEIDFDDVDFFARYYRTHPGGARLAVDVRVLYPLRVPVVRWIFFQLWMAQSYLGVTEVSGDLQDWARLRGRVEGGRCGGEYLDECVERGPISPESLLRSQDARDALALQQLAKWTRAAGRGVFLIPLHASYSMQMQSNIYRDNLREPVLFTTSD